MDPRSVAQIIRQNPDSEFWRFANHREIQKLKGNAVEFSSPPQSDASPSWEPPELTPAEIAALEAE